MFPSGHTVPGGIFLKENATIKCALSGCAAGVLNGLFGAGGGMVLVPLLTRWCGLEDRKAFATGLAIILPMCLVSLSVYLLHDAVDIRSSIPYLLGGFAGGLLGGIFFHRIPVKWLHRTLGILILYGGIRKLIG